MTTMPRQRPGRSKQDYATPAAFIAAVQRRLGIEAFVIDFAADAANAKAARHLDITTDGLRLEWSCLLPAGAWGWLNPPFGRIEPWSRKCVALREAGGQVAFLVPASVGADWWKDHVHGQASVLLLNGRLSFLEGGESYPKDCVLALYSPVMAPGYEV